MTEAEWSDLLACIIAAGNLSTSAYTIEAADRAYEWLMNQDWTPNSTD